MEKQLYIVRRNSGLGGAERVAERFSKLQRSIPVTSDIVVVDSGSTDGTVALCENLALKLFVDRGLVW